ncbi:IS256 family transposase [uncultured Fibrobacter sp.]|uniref:IS256 family transposase n=1 Tax=uncultured Fibrobacter sp. TaxID=261512 RepID=UPI002805BCF4|nr:IS256 family transposase [uncultured Fibrobacter sp.]
MERNIIKIDEAGLKDDLKTLIRGTVEDTLNAMLDEEAASLCNAERHERSEGRSKIEEWRNRPLSGEYPYVFVDGIYLKRSWGGEMASVSVLVAIGVNGEGYREILGAAEGASESKECWKSFLKSLKGVRLFTSDKHLGFLESASEVFPDARWQRCAVHFFRNVFTKVPRNRFPAVAALLKATYAQEDREATLAKTRDVERKLRDMKLSSAADVYAKGVGETLTYLEFPHEHWRNIRTNNILERLNREIRRRTRVVGCFPDGESALMLVCARLRHVASKEWGTKRYLNMKHLYELEKENELKREQEKHGKKVNVA